MSTKSPSTRQVIIEKLVGKSAISQPDLLAIEEPLEIRLSSPVATKKVSVTMRTPGNDEELALGFLFTEGIISNIDEVVSWKAEGEHIISISINNLPNVSSLERNFYTTSSCGVCGKASIDAIKTISLYQSDSSNNLHISSELLCKLPDILRNKQRIFEDTGGLHASALFDAEGNILLLREDVGRHNALDKLIGAAMVDSRLPLSTHILLLSGRASFELIQKAAMAGISIVAAVGAPSSLAVSLAEEMGMTLVGFLRENRFNIYTGSKRIVYENQDQG
jgi:FdhD protein